MNLKCKMRQYIQIFKNMGVTLDNYNLLRKYKIITLKGLNSLNYIKIHLYLKSNQFFQKISKMIFKAHKTVLLIINLLMKILIKVDLCQIL